MLDASIEDTIVTRSYTGKPCRCIQNDRIKRFEDNFGSIKDYDNPKFQMNFGPTGKA